MKVVDVLGSAVPEAMYFTSASKGRLQGENEAIVEHRALFNLPDGQLCGIRVMIGVQLDSPKVDKVSRSDSLIRARRAKQPLLSWKGRVIQVHMVNVRCISLSNVPLLLLNVKD